MVLTDVDQVMVEDGNGKSWYSQVNHSARCRAAARAASLGDDAFVLHASQQRGDMSQSDQWKADRLDLIAQIKQRKTAGSLLAACGPADHRPFQVSSRYFLARADQAVTRRARDRRAAPQAIQLDLIDNGREHLIHYDEMPVTDAQFSTFALPLAHSKYSCAGGFDNAQVIANVLDAARAPSRAEAIMMRGGRRDLCVLSKAPTN